MYREIGRLKVCKINSITLKPPFLKSYLAQTHDDDFGLLDSRQLKLYPQMTYRLK